MRRILGAVVIALVVAGCSSTSKVTGTNNTGSTPITLAHGSMSATINGTNWVANTAIDATYTNGVLLVSGADASALALAVSTVASGPGTYAVGLTDPTSGILTQGGGATWEALLSTGSGSIVISTLTSTGASGTFSFVMPALSGSSATGTKTVTNGTFNVTF